MIFINPNVLLKIRGAFAFSIPYVENCPKFSTNGVV